MARWILLSLHVSMALAPAADRPGAQRPASELDHTQYKSTAASGAVAALHTRLERGEARLDFAAKQGYLLALLRELKIPPSSQLLVASKTSPNKAHISPKNPRALYYNDSVGIAFVPGAELIEVAAADPKLGVVFYTLEQKEASQPRLTRDDRCLECHASPKTLNTPGWLVRSFKTDLEGEVDLLSGIMVTHGTPIHERWGGYYVTGDTGGQPHRGNLFPSSKGGLREPVAEGGTSLTDLKALLDVDRFIMPSSDVVALLVLEHQVHMMNLLARLRMDAEALSEQDDFSRAHPATENVLRYLLFTEEAALTGQIHGTSGFSSAFESLGPRDSRGRSLRQFDLTTRLFKHPCSYMVYSPGMDALPLRARRHLYHRLWQVLSGEDITPVFKGLSPETRNDIREILLETKKDLPAYWRL